MIEKITSFLFVLVVFITTRRFPFSFLVPLMNISVIAILLISLFKNRFQYENVKIVLLWLVMPLTVSFMYSMFLTDNKLTLIVRFYIILLTVGLAYFIDVNKRALEWFIWLNVLQSIILISIFLALILFFNQANYLPVRFFFLGREWGDVYTYGGVIYKVQIVGSALLPVALIVNNEMTIQKRKNLVSSILMLGIVLAGNFAFLIAIAFYVMFLVVRIKNEKLVEIYLSKVLIFIFVILLTLPVLVPFVIETISLKREISLGNRFDQVKYLMHGLFSSPTSALFGQGLGNTLDVVSPFRDYKGDFYFELQTVYILNQLGILFFLTFLIYNILMVIKKWGKSFQVLIFIYILYIIYAVTNPYIWDTTHFIVIIVLNSMIKYSRHAS